MLDFDASKLLIIGVVALIVIGPKDLPGVLRQVGQLVSKVRRMAGEFQGQFLDAMKEADLQDLRDEVSKLKNTASLDVDFNPVRDATAELSKAMDGVATPAGHLPPRRGKDFNIPAPTAPGNLLAAGVAPVPEDMAGDASTGVMDLPRPDEAVDSEDAVLPIAGPSDMEAASSPIRRRKITVPKRRPPGNRLGPAGGRPLAIWRSRSYLPPRREIPTS